MKVIVIKKKKTTFRFPNENNVLGFKINFKDDDSIKEKLRKARLFNEGASILTSC